jgi:hypothetical protein
MPSIATFSMAGFEPGPSVYEADAMTTVPFRKGMLLWLFNAIKIQNNIYEKFCLSFFRMKFCPLFLIH